MSDEEYHLNMPRLELANQPVTAAILEATMRQLGPVLAEIQIRTGRPARIDVTYDILTDTYRVHAFSAAPTRFAWDPAVDGPARFIMHPQQTVEDAYERARQWIVENTPAPIAPHAPPPRTFRSAWG